MGCVYGGRLGGYYGDDVGYYGGYDGVYVGYDLGYSFHLCWFLILVVMLWLDIVLDYLGWILFVLNLWGKTKDQMR